MSDGNALESMHMRETRVQAERRETVMEVGAYLVGEGARGGARFLLALVI